MPVSFAFDLWSLSYVDLACLWLEPATSGYLLLGRRWSASKMVICFTLGPASLVSKRELNSLSSAQLNSTGCLPGPVCRQLSVGRFSWSVEARNYLTLNVGIRISDNFFFARFPSAIAASGNAKLRSARIKSDLQLPERIPFTLNLKFFLFNTIISISCILATSENQLAEIATIRPDEGSIYMWDVNSTN